MKDINQIGAEFDAMIARHGWAVQAVFAEKDSPGFAYTAGLSAFGLPELIVFGLPPPVAHQLLNQLGRRLRDGEALSQDTDLLDVVEGYPARLVPAPRSATDQYMFATQRRYPHYRALQLVWSDPAGRFPWDPAFDPKYRPLQPVLDATPR